MGSISAISGSSYSVNVYSQLNNNRLSQILAARASNTSSNSISAIPALSKVSSSVSSANADFLRKYQSDMASMMASSQNLRDGYYSSGKYGETQDNQKTADAINKMVETFNSSLTTLNDNSDLGVGVLQQMRRMVTTPVSEKSMNFVGITVNSDGTMKFDKDKFIFAAESNSSLTNDLVGKIATGIYNDAKAGLNTSSNSLLSKTQQKATFSSLTEMMNTSSPTFWNMYSKSGVYNMANFNAVGSLLNLTI